MTLQRLPLLSALAGALVLAGCDFEPTVPVAQYSLNEKALADNADLQEDLTAQAHLAGALEMLFGVPASPGYMKLEDWIDEEIDPNPGKWALSDEDYDAMVESNRFHFRDAIAAIEAGNFDAVEFRYADDLWQDWLSLLEEMPEGGPDDALYEDDDGEPVSWRSEAVYLFESYYPTLATSSEMYRQQCAHCHGTSGGGDGSTSEFLNPRPRDYRNGIFKFTALGNKARPRHDDLFRILAEGIYTTAMPSFRRFSDAQLHGLADYVRLLSMRGETEILLAQDFDPDEKFGGIEAILETYRFVHDRWEGAADNLVAFDGDVPEASPERIAHGAELFRGEEGRGANCASCHGPDGRGGGPSAFETNPETGEVERVKDDWGNEIAPRDLTRGVYRFGRRPIDIYRRIYSGINGTPMPEHFGMQITEEDGNQRPLTEDDIWDLVFFVRSLATEPMTVADHSASSHSSADGH